MSKSRASTLPSALAILLCASPALADRAPAPKQYTLTQVSALFGAPMTMTIYRDGDVAVFDHADTGTRGYNDLAHGRSFSWNVKEAAPECGMAQFSGDWGDPFGPGLTDELTKLHTKEAGAEVVNGIHTKVIEVDNPQAGLPKYKMWLDTTYGEAVKLTGPGASGAVATLTEIKSLTIGKPPAAVFEMPASCKKLAAQPPPPTEAEQIAALTGAPAGKYIKSESAGPASKETCAVLFSLVKPKTLAPVTAPFRIGVDAAGIDLNNPPHYITGEAGKPYFQGGGLHEVTQDYKNGTLRLESVPPVFYMELSWDVHGAGGAVTGGSGGTAMLYRQCNGKSTARLLLVADPEKPGETSAWVWEK